MSRLLGESNAANKIPIKALRNEIKLRVAQVKFVMIIIYNRDGIQMSLQYGEVINNMWQSPGGKTDREPSIEVALRELKKETDLMAESETLKFPLNDPNYNSNVYTLKVLPNIKLDLMKPNKNGK